MARKEEMEIIIGESGAVSVQVSGVKGGKCLDLTKDLEEALGVVVSRDKTGEFCQIEGINTNKLNIK